MFPRLANRFEKLRAYLAKPTRQAQPSDQEYQASVSDREARKKEVEALVEMVRLTRLQLVIGVATTLGLLSTLWMTNESLMLSRQSADLNRTATYASLTPYLLREDTAFRDVVGDYMIVYSVANTGSTAARNIRSRSYFRVMDPIPAGAVVCPEPGTTRYFPSEDIAPGNKPQFGFLLPPVSREDIVAIKENRKALFVSVEILFDDVFGQPHRYGFSEFRYGPNLAGNHINRLMIGGVVPTGCPTT